MIPLCIIRNGKTSSSQLNSQRCGSFPELVALKYDLAIGGFSLIELLVSMALLAILSGIGISLFAIINNSYSRANSISRIQSQGSTVAETVERTIRSATDANSAPTWHCASGIDNTCISLSIPISSIEYQLNGGCPITQYDWYAPNGTTSNGRLTRNWLNSDGSQGGSCGAGPSDLFDTDTVQGISVEQIGTTPIFSITTNSAGPSTVTISMNLTQGVTISNRASVPFVTTVSLRDY